ncbi:acyltransferase family protein [Achromobacter xylosoxidans]|uniref:acyltransferase family protein n=1 Tax=Alcaligenes xylosoxydans xylosoxydans TaxID=85698 RepID=UPI00384C92EA
MSTQTLAAISQGGVNRITSFRLVAAWAVIYSHAFMINGRTERDWMGTIRRYATFRRLVVIFFFLLNGFLVCSSLESSLISRYWTGRTLRLFRNLWLRLFAVASVLGGIVAALALKKILNVLGAIAKSTILVVISWHGAEKPMLLLQRFLRRRQQAYEPRRAGQIEKILG